MLLRIVSTLILLALLTTCGLGAPGVVMADSPATWWGEVAGVQTWVTVLARGHEIPPEVRARESWWRWGNATTDAYLFAFHRPDDVRLIIAFEQQPDGTPEARFYFDELGQKPLDYVMQGGNLRVRTNGGHPNLRMRPVGGGWFIGNQVNYDLLITIDGPYHFGGGGLFGNPEATTDGIVDVEVRVGSQEPGVPSWQTTRVVQDPHPSWAYPRFGAVERLPDAPPFKVAKPIMPSFPYFDIDEDRGGAIDWFAENPNPLYFDVSRLRFEIFPFPGFQNGGMQTVNSLTLPPKVNFEVPFVFYSFDPTTRYAQLAIRPDYRPSGGRFSATRSADLASFRYSWKTFDRERWSYSVQVAGPYTYDGEARIGDVQLASVSASELPSWVLAKEWSVTSFVEAVNGYPGSEGIYYYSAQDPESWRWLDGFSDQSPSYFSEPYLQDSRAVEFSSVLPAGFRGEYNPAHFRRPLLYFSSIDSRLHLLHAQGGMWNLGDGLVLRTHNLDGDAHVDGWTRERVAPQETGGKPAKGLTDGTEEALYVLKGTVLYSGPKGAAIGTTTLSPSRFETQPPVDKASWAAFRELLAPYRDKGRDPRDLAGWLPSLAAQLTQVSGAQVSQVRATDTGVRFNLALAPGFSVSEPTGQSSWLVALQPGSYSVSYTPSAGYSVRPLSPASPRVIDVSAILPQTVALSPTTLRATVENKSLEDARNVVLQFRAGRTPDSLVEIGSQTLDVPAESTAEVSLNWTPPVGGQWVIQVSAAAATSSTATLGIAVANAPTTDLPSVLTIQRFVGPLGFVAGLLLAAILVVAVRFGLLLWREAERGQIALERQDGDHA